MVSSKMDINSLLQDAPPSQHNPSAPTPSRTPHPLEAPPKTQSFAPSQGIPTVPESTSAGVGIKKATRGKRKVAPLVQRAVASPQRYNRNPIIPPAHNIAAQAHHQTPPPLGTAPPLVSGRSLNSGPTTPSADYRSSPLGYNQIALAPPLPQRRTSTEKMDFLADLASMQQYPQQSTQSNHRSLLNPTPQDNPRSPSMPPLSRRGSAVPLQADHPMSDAPTATLQPRAFATSSLSKSDLKTVSNLTKALAENSFLYDSHAKLIKLLHQGLVSHISSSEIPETSQFFSDYALLQDLRQAREAMDSRFPVGEELWIEWIQDECMLSRSIDDRVAVMELCQKAVQDEVGSTKIWQLYGDWMRLLYRTAHDITESGTLETNSLLEHEIVGPLLTRQRWTEDEKVIAREVFGWDVMISVWEQGIKATEWHIDESHVVWNPYIEILMHDLSSRATPDKIQAVRSLFEHRLQQPHEKWNDTFQIFSQFVSTYDNASYEQTMVNTTRLAAPAKHEYEVRQENETKLRRAADTGDKTTEWTVINEYLEWEVTQLMERKPSPFSFDLLVALFQRANLRFPTDAEIWEDHVDMLLENSDARHPVLPLVRNATRHCPWSGNLWAKRFTALEAAGNSYEEIEDVKHHATSSGLLEGLGGMEELIKVYTSWCGFLRRRAFYSPNSGEDERDMAEVGIRSTIGDVNEIGEKKYGKDFKGDPQFSIQRIYMKFLSQAERYDEVRTLYTQLSATFGDQWEFWDRFYNWEMTVWARLDGSHVPMPPPERATAILQQAIRRSNMDWPEKMNDVYLQHCAQHESAPRLLEAQIEVRRALKQVVKRRAEEAADAAELQAATLPHESGSGIAEVTQEGATASSGKRKRSDDLTARGQTPAKKSRPEAQNPSAEETSLAPAQPKRDRENTTIIVKKLPAATTETRIRQFFRDCGAVLSLKLGVDQGGASATATIEFESKEDVLTAQTKGMKSFDGHNIEIEIAADTTLWVTNYPAEADEAYIRNLFKHFGEVVDVRFPSLNFNTHRRFCYVQFLSPSQARAATQLDGKALGGKFILTAKISDPSARKERGGAMEEGREIFVGNLLRSATEDDVQSMFASYPVVQHVRIPKNMQGRSKGSAFVVFETLEQANAAIEMDAKEFNGRVLKVSKSVSNAKGVKHTATTILNGVSPGQNTPDVAMAGSPGKETGTNQDQASNEAHDYRLRTLVLKNIPDTVNDARIRVLVEKYGALRKVSLRPQRNEAIVEFVELQDAGKAEMGIAGHEIAPGRFVEVGRMGGGVAEASGQNARPAFAPTSIKRPGQGGRRGGLGFKSRSGGGFGAGGGGAEKTGNRENPKTNGSGDAGGAAKSNADFRAMLGGA